MKVRFPRFLISMLILYVVLLFIVSIFYNFEEIVNMMRNFYFSTLGKGAAGLIAICILVTCKYMFSIFGLSFAKGKKKEEKEEDMEEEEE